MFQPHPWPKAVLHLDANAFFASVMQVVCPKLKGQPVVVGAERGIATAISYEARAYGIKRGMLMSQIKELCPQVKILVGDYEVFGLFSQKMFGIVRHFCPVVEEYSIDEGFMDITGLRRPLNSTYKQIALNIQTKIYNELGLPISVGVSLTKTLSKLASGFVKPMGVTLISGQNIESYLAKTPLIKVWGIGPSTTSYLAKYNIKTALDFANLPKTVFQKSSAIKLNKSIQEIWMELQGNTIYQINPDVKNQYQSIGKTHTFHPPSQNSRQVWAELLSNVELSFAKARKYHYFVEKMFIYLKTQEFRYISTEVELGQKQQYPMLFRHKLNQAFKKIFKPNCLYRATGVTLTQLSQSSQEQGSLFSQTPQYSLPKVKALYQAISKQPKIDFGASLYLPNRQTKSQLPTKSIRLPHFKMPLLEI